MTALLKVRFAGLGSHAPERRMTNHDLEKLVETTDDWIVQRTGIRERRIAPDDACSSDLAAEAARRALDQARVRPEDVDLIYFATSSPDRVVPSSAPYLQAKLGCFNAGACDVLAACSGFMYAATAGWHAVAGGQSKCCLVVGAEMLSKITNYRDRGTCIIFGDGAGAAVLTPSDGTSDILYSRNGADGRLADLIIIPAGGTAMMPTAERLEKNLHTIHMQGREVYKYAVPKFVELITEALKSCRLTLDDLRLVIPHQMNLRMIEGVADRLGVPLDRFFLNIERYGNTSSASIPIAFDEAAREGRLRRGDLVLLTAMGAGITWGTMILRY